MASQPPLVLVDNVLEHINLYPTATLSSSSALSGREALRVADYRRDRTWWEPVDAGANPLGNWVQADLGVGVTRSVDFLYIDRSHNLWGKSVIAEGGDDGATFPSSVTLTVPAATVVGGDPTTSTMVVTEEGALYSTFTALTARRYWRFRVPYVAAFIPLVYGVILGLKDQFAGYSSIYDEDQGERTSNTEVSRAGYLAADRTYSWRICELGLELIGSAEYDAQIRTLRRKLFELNEPCVVIMDWATYSARGWMYRFDGSAWGLPKRRTLRSGRIRLREHMPVVF